MHRLTARLLLLFALAGSLIPLAQAVTAAPQPHACCVRKAHHCHDSAGEESAQLIIRSAGCCNHDCCRAAITSQWASPQKPTAPVIAQSVTTVIADSHPNTPITRQAASSSTRAPPQVA
jgi:hypothetical protein